MGDTFNERKVLARAKSWQLGESSNGKERVEVTFTYAAPDAGQQTITWYGYFSTEKVMNRTIESLRTCGWNGDDLATMEGLDANEVELVIADEEYENKVYTKVQWVNRAGPMSTPLTADKAKSFAASMRDRIRAIDASKGKQAAKSAPPASAGKQEDFESDIPF